MARDTTTWRRLGAVALVATLLVTSCSRGDDDSDSTSSTTLADLEGGDDPIINVEGKSIEEPDPELGIQLGEGDSGTDVTESVVVVQGDPLTDSEADEVLDDLPDWNLPDDDSQEFNLPPETLQPPTDSEDVEAPFPPSSDPGSAPEVDPGSLEVVRYQPEGDVDIAPFLTVTFNQPMVPLATLETLDLADVPAVVTPSVEGRWRWIGTRTLRFELEPGEIDRLPAATDYVITIPAGTESATGAKLDSEVSWSFTTPPPSVDQFVGQSESLSLTPVFVAVFDQRVDGDGVLSTTRVLAGGDEVAIRLATTAEVEADDHARGAIEAALPDRAVAFRATEELPPDTAINIVIGPGTPSAEGPNTSTQTANFSGRTFGSLEILEYSCNWGSPCEPGSPFNIEFSNPLEPSAFEADLVDVSPDIPGLRVDVYGTVIQIYGSTQGNTDYTVTLDADLEDVFGQTLGKQTELDFSVGSARPFLRGLDRDWITTDPTAPDPTVSVTTVNHESIDVKAWAVTPVDIEEFQNLLEVQWSDTNPPEPEWPVAFEETITIDADTDQVVETTIDLSSAFELAGSQLVVRVEPTRSFPPDSNDYWQNRPRVAWVQSTTLGIDAFFDQTELLIWTTDLTTGEPVGHIPVQLLGDGRVATTDEDGLARLDLGDVGVDGLWARDGDRTSMLPSGWREGWRARESNDEYRWYIFDDRGIYRPGETAHLTGWIRRLALTEDAQLELFDEDSEVSYIAYDAQGAEIATGSADLNALSGFNISIDVPEGANLGPAWIELSLPGAEKGETYANHSFAIQEFRTPEFEVTAHTETAGPFFSAEPATVVVDATYYSGGPLPDAEVNWLVSTTETTYTPPNWSDFNFGVWVPWWYGGDDFYGGDVEADFAVGDCFDCGPGFGSTEYETFTGRTDASGSHYLNIDFDGPDVDLPSTVSAEATVFDVNRQAWTSRTDLLVHPAEYYIGLQAARTFVELGTPIVIDAVVTDVDGDIIGDRAVEIVAGRLESTYTNGEWVEELADAQTCTFDSTEDATDVSMRCEFNTDVGGTYQITAIVADDSGHRNRTEITQWVSGGRGRPARDVEHQQVTIIPDHETYEPGDTAELLVQAPFSPAHGFYTITRNGIVSTESFTAEDGSAIIEVPIEDAHIPNLTLHVEMVGSAERAADDGTPLPDATPRTAFASGQIAISVPPATRALEVVATPAESELEPGASTTISVDVLDFDGNPVEGADVAIVVVDEAVLALTGYELTDPLDVFYSNIYSWLDSVHIRSSIQLVDPESLGGGEQSVTAEAGIGDLEESSDDSADGDFDTGLDEAESGGANRASATPIDIRSDFEPLAMYSPEESTDADGNVTVDLDLPDNLTRYRVMAVAVAGADKFGKGESTVTARLPLMVRPSAPRFLNFGDRAELPVVLQNQTDDEIEVDVAIEVANLNLESAPGQRVVIPANDRVEVRFPVTTVEVGTARVRIAAVSGSYSDAAEIAMPVYTPATAEAFAVYGVVDEGSITQPLLAPTGVFPQFGGLEISTSSTALQALTDAVLYLTEYRYESSDALASRIMAIATLRDVLDAFEADGLPDTAELNRVVTRDVAGLVQLQNDDGGWPYWQRGRESIPWQSIQVTHALVLADQEGYQIPANTMSRALEHLGSIEQHIPSDYSQQVRDTLSAYALYVLTTADHRDAAKATDLYRRAGENLQIDALAWLWPSIIDEELRAEIETRITNSAVETAGAVTFATGYGEDAYLIANSDRRTDGIVLDALITESPDSDLIPKAVAGLLANQTNGHWNNAHENAFILVAMHRYFNTFESVEPDFVARAWLGETYVSEYAFRGYTTEQAYTLVPMGDVISNGDANLIVAKDGDGRLYYRVGLKYAPDDLDLDARDEGFVVERIYEGVDDPADVERLSDGTWRIRAGSNVRVTLTMVADARRTNVALVDPLPAGLEPINPSLAVSQTIIPEDDDSPQPWFWGWNWFQHQNLRDDRVEAFTSYLSGGTYEYSYVARATTPGEFVVPPAKAEEIYSPEVFGRTATAKVIIE